jgi:hypothetical protein
MFLAISQLGKFIITCILQKDAWTGKVTCKDNFSILPHMQNNLSINIQYNSVFN